MNQIALSGTSLHIDMEVWVISGALVDVADREALYRAIEGR